MGRQLRGDPGRYSQPRPAGNVSCPRQWHQAPKRPAQAKSREEWEATRKIKGQQAKERAAEIRAAYAAHVANLKATQGAAHQARRAEAEKLWNTYKADRKAIRDRYQPFIDAIYKSKRKAPPHPYTEQALRDLEETAEWKEFGRQQFRQRRLFNARECSLLGVIGNAVRLHHSNRNAPGMPGLFKLVFSGRALAETADATKTGPRRHTASFLPFGTKPALRDVSKGAH